MGQAIRRGTPAMLTALALVILPASSDISLAASCVQCRSSSDRPCPYESSGTRRMAERLEALNKKTDPDTNIYDNRERVKRFRARLAEDSDPFPLRRELAIDLLRSGESAEAIKAFLGLKDSLNRDSSAHPLLRLSTGRELAISYLRLGEQDNCISLHNADSCLMPIRDGGVYTVQRGPRAAIKEYRELLKLTPDDLGLRWLLNIAYMTLGEYPDGLPSQWLIPPKAFESEHDVQRFRDVAPRLSLDAVGLAGGSVMEDLDGDGHLDIMVSSWGSTDQLHFFRNKGDGTFTNCTVEAGLKGVMGGLNLVHADYNNDSHADVLVLRGAWLEANGRLPNSLLRNNGDGTFDDVTEEAGLLSFHPTQTAAWADFDNDGQLDLFIGNESTRHDLRGSEIHLCELYHNNGDGTFTDVAKEAGVDFEGFVKGVAWGDYNNDGQPDLYLSVLGNPNALYRNEGPSGDGQWRFTDVDLTEHPAGVAEPLYSFPTWFWDHNNDGWLDILVLGYVGDVGTVAADYLGTDHSEETACLYQNNRDGTFTNVTTQVKLDRVFKAMGCNFGDLDNDGYLDFYVGTGDPSLESLVPNRMFRNVGGRFFQDVTTSGGFGHLQKGHGVAFGDIDHDGDQDVYAVIGGAFVGDIAHNVLFENPGHGNHWITLRLEGRQTNRGAIGARIKVKVESRKGTRDIYATVSTGGSFGSSSLQQEIGLGQARSIQSIEITWPATGKVQAFEKVQMNQILRIVEGQTDPIPVAVKPIELKGSASKDPHGSKKHHKH